MIREKVVPAVVATGLLLLTGCGLHESNPTEIDLTVLPDKLPAAVAELAARAVLINMVTDTGSVDYGSGFRINDTQVLTAGHIFVDGDNKAFPGVNECNSIFVHGHSQILDSSNSNSPDTEGKSIDVRRFVGSNEDDNTIPDIALLNIKPGSFSHISELPMRTDAVHLGERVYFFSYQQNGGRKRDPVQEPVEMPQKPRGYLAPAIYGGIVFGWDASGKIRVADGLKSYGQINDGMAIHGASGGMLVDDRGREIGEIVESRTDTTKISAKELGSDDDIGLADGMQFTQASQDLRISMALVEPTPPSIMKKLKTELVNAPLCRENK